MKFIKAFLRLIKNLLLFIIAPFIGLILMPINVLVVFVNDWKNKGFKSAVKGVGDYFYESALRQDKFYCSEYRSLWNATLKIKQGKPIGVNGRSLSADIGQQDVDGTMSRTGAILNLILFLFERNHSRKAFNDLKK